MSKRYNSKLNLTKVFGTTIIALCFVMSAFMGFFVTVGGSQVAPGPMNIPEVIDGVDVYRENLGTYNHGGSLTITNGGSLTLVNSVLNIEQDSTTGYNINVNTGSTLKLVNSVITTAASERIDTEFYLDVIFLDSALILENSVLAYPGNLDVTNTVTYINDSWVTSPWTDISTPDKAAWAGKFPIWENNPNRISEVRFAELFPDPDDRDSRDDGPIIYFDTSDDVTIADSRIDEMYEDANLESNSFSATLYPNAFDAGDNATGASLLSFQADDNNYYDVFENETMWIDGFAIGYSDTDYIVQSVMAYLIYDTTGTNASGQVNWAIEGQSNNTWFSPVSNVTEVLEVLDLTGQVTTISQISDLDISWFNWQPFGDGTGYGGIERLWLEVTLQYTNYYDNTMFYLFDSDISVINSYVSVDFTPLSDGDVSNNWNYNKYMLESNSHLYLYNNTVQYDGNYKEGIFRIMDTSQVFYYKWADVNVVDDNGSPVENTFANFTFRHTDPGIVAYVYDMNDLSDNSVIDQRILNYLDRVNPDRTIDNTNYNITDSNGNVMLPLLNTLFDATTSANGNHTGEYELDVRYWDGGAWHVPSGEVSVDFPSYPTIHEWTDNTVEPVGGTVVLDTLQLPKPDVAPGNITFTPDEPNVYEGDTIDISIEIRNLGLTNALDVYYEVYDNYGVNRDLVYNRTVPTIGAGGNVVDTFQWVAVPGVAHYFEVSVDPMNAIDEDNETNNINDPFEPLNVTPFLPELVINQPGISFNPAPASVGNPVTIEAIIHNQGFQNASNIEVRFYYQNPDVDGDYVVDTAASNYLIGTDTIDIDWDIGNFVDPDETAIATTTWTPVNDTDMDVYVWVDPLKAIAEYDDETNNSAFNTLVVDPKPNLVVTETNITFTGGTPIDDPPTPIGVDVEIWNLGGITTGLGFDVEFYDEGVLFATEPVPALGAGASTVVSTTWIPADKGYHGIKVILDSAAVIDESYETDNSATTQVLVYNTTYDLIVNNTNTPFQVFDSDNPSFNQHGYVLVEENGVLEIRNSTFLMSQVYGNQFEIIVRDTGMLILDNSTLSGNDLSLTVYVRDGATLYIKNSIVDAGLKIICQDNAQIQIEGSEIGAELDITGNLANVNMEIRESSLDKPLNDITGTSVVNLVATTMTQSVITSSDSSEVYIYRLLTVQVTDANGYPLANVDLDLNYAINNPVLIAMLYQTGTTDANGMFVFEAMSDIITPSVYPTSQPVGNYMIDATYTFQGVPYMDSQGVSLPYYPDMSISDNYIHTTLVMDNVRPDLDPPLYVSASNIGRGENLWINTTISNNGISPAENILVRFMDETAGTVIEDVYIDELQPAPLADSSVDLSVVTSWNSVADIGAHLISVEVDPYNWTSEFNESDNYNYTTITVAGMPDLEIETAGDIIITPSAANRVRDNPINFQVEIANNGDIAAQNVTLHIYEEEGGAVIGNDTIASIAPGGSGYATVTWDSPAVGTYDVYFIIDEDQDINEIDETNNNRTIENIVVQDFSDVWVSAVTFELLNDPTPITEVDNRTSIRIQAIVENNGGVTATGVAVDFYDDTTGDWLGSDTVPAIAGGGVDQEVAEIIWFATGSAAGAAQDHEIRAVASGNLYESSSVNNGLTETLTINDPRPDLTFLSADDIVITTENVTENQEFDINVTVYNIGNGPAANVTIDLYHDNVTEDNWLGTFYAGLLGAGANITVGWEEIGPIEGEGIHNIFAVVDMEVDTDDNFTVSGTLYDLIGAVEEFDETNNVINNSFSFLASSYSVTITDPIAGQSVNISQETLVVIGTVTDQNGDGVEGVEVSVEFLEQTYTGTSSFGGSLYIIITNLSAEPGTHTLTISADGISDIPVSIQLIGVEDGLPWMLIIILVIVIVGAAIGGITAYLYFFGLGKTVECGNCGAFIPESADKCPKCGTEFETETAKCSVCGAWVPMDAKTCPECESEFTIGEVEGIDYEAQMKKQYDNVVNGFKEQAKKELGNKYSEKAFQAWWAKQPTFITFEQWLKEEEEMKKLGSKPCPYCATPNSVTATICHKCGTIMEDEKKEAPPKKEEAKPGPKKEEPKAEPSADAAAPAVAATAAATETPAEAAPDKKKCPSCGMEVNADEKTCPICSYEWKDDAPREEPPGQKGGGGEQPRVQKKVVAKKAVVQKPVKKVVRRPVKKQGE